VTAERNNNPHIAPPSPPSVTLRSWDASLTADDQRELANIIPEAMKHRRWFGGKAREIAGATIETSIAVPHESGTSYLLFVDIRYADQTQEGYLVPVSLALGDHAQQLLDNASRSVLLRVTTPQGDGVLYDAVADRGFVLALLNLIDRAEVLNNADAQIATLRTSAFDNLSGSATSVEPRVIGVEQSNSSIVFGDHLILKLFRRPEPGINPDFELGSFLTDHGFASMPPVAGGLELRSASPEPRTIGILQGFVRNEGDAWAYTLRSFAESIAAAPGSAHHLLQLDIPQESALDLATEQVPAIVSQLAGDYLQSAALLGERTAQMHVTLSSNHEDPNFAPVPFSDDYRQSVHQDMREHAQSVFQLLRANLDRLPPDEISDARRLANREQELLDLYSEIVRNSFEIQRIRVHGDYHLGQVLYTGSDFVIIDFEGEPLRSLAQRRMKRSPLRDVAGMMRSFDYAAHTGMTSAIAGGSDKQLASHFAQLWREWVCATFLRAYLETCACVHLVPTDRRDAAVLLDAFLLDKAVYELGYEINNRPDWVGIPIAGITRILDERATAARAQRVA
jgi:maltose alpha-D-glucosyltransferase/alpha-amylase